MSRRASMRTRVSNELVRWILLASCGLVIAGLPSRASSQQPVTKQRELLRLSERYHQALIDARPPLYYELLNSTDPAVRALNDDPRIRLMYIDAQGMPVYYITHNFSAAKFINTWRVWPEGTSVFSFTGNRTQPGELAIWDAGAVRSTHQEFGGRVTQMDTAVTTHYHATHVAGTLVAGGVSTSAKGMSFEAPLHAYEWDDDESEMAAAAAAGLRVSNHSYGIILGWIQDSEGSWYWFGHNPVSSDEDYKFGFYGPDAQIFDEIAYNAPYYTIVVAAGNDRDDAGPPPGTEHYHYNPSTGWFWLESDTHNDDNASPDGEDTLGPKSCAKNVITVGAGQYVIGSNGLKAVDFSAAGPTDDGRVKPDVMSDGSGLFSCIDDSDTSYDILSGTSMASPGVAGSVNLLVHHYEEHYDKVPLSSTMKAVVISTADTEGLIVPKSTIGWGKLDTEAAAELIASPPGGDGIIEATLHDGETHRYYFYHDPSNWDVTVAWTDPPGTTPAPSVDPPTPMLVNDLDIRMMPSTGDTIKPVVVDWGAFPHPVTTGDNSSDNVEKLRGGPPMGPCVLTVSSKGTLSSGEQAYSLVWRNLQPDQPPAPGGPAVFAAIDLGYPDQPPSTHTFVENQEQGIFITAIKDFNLRGVGMKLTIPCENTMTVAVYRTIGGTRDIQLATATATVRQPGEVFHYVPVSCQLEACQDYEIVVEFEETIQWPYWSEPAITLPYDVGGVIRVHDGQQNGNPGNPDLAHFAITGNVVETPELSDLEPTGASWTWETLPPGERGVFVKAEKTATISSLKWGASFAARSSNPVGVRIYEAEGTIRGPLIARNDITIFSFGGGSGLYSVPISAVLKEGKSYNLVALFEPEAWQYVDEHDIAFPFNVDGFLRVLDGESGGDLADSLLTHFGVNWIEGAGGVPYDLAKPGEAPEVSTADTFNPGVFVTSLIDQELYSIGWMADIPEGVRIGARIYEATGPVRHGPIAQGEIVSAGSGMRWHDIPVSAELAAGAGYDVEMILSAANAWEAWIDLTGLPYQPYGVIEIVDAEGDGDPASRLLPHLRVNLCNRVSTGIEDRPTNAPKFFVSAPFPNPASGHATIEYALDAAGPVWITVYDVAGRRVSTILDGARMPAGPGVVQFDASDLPTGVYFLRMTAREHNVTRKIAVVR